MAAFAGTVLLGAFLLFQVQPVVSKAILPWFGGSPAVWTTCMLFFQVLLFGGYVYAHLLERWLQPRHQAAVHLGLIALAAAMLPIVPSQHWRPADASHPTLRILLLLAATVGLPYFVLAGTSPLVQAWFTRRWPGRSPYRLYALSNFGSLAALLSYPFLFEPAMGLSGQSVAWALTFALYAAFVAVSLVCLWRCQTEQLDANAPSPRQACVAARPSNWDRFRWVALPALGSLMLLAATNHVCQDVAVVPFLWVLPLALYLLSFIICFDHSRWYVRPLWAVAALVALGGTMTNDALLQTETHITLPVMLQLYLSAMFCACMVAHGELARLKPNPRHLTEYYLFISAGGALGGVFVGILAPLCFSTYFEWPIAVASSGLLAFGLLVLPRRVPTSNNAKGLQRPAKQQTWPPVPTWATRWRLSFLFGPTARCCRYAVFGCAVGGSLAYLTTWADGLKPPLDRSRNFFGTVTVTEYGINDGYHELMLTNGRIKHGRQFVDAERRRWPTSYYGEPSGVGRAIRYLQNAGPLRAGIVGLGAGTIAAYARPGDTFRFYEINPEVLRLARQRFTYLADCRGTCDVVLGDARLSLEAERPQGYRLLVIDAFSGDAIPTHLLTCEAFGVYRQHLAPHGVIAVHVSNQYLRLAPVVQRLAEHWGMQATQVQHDCSEEEGETQALDNSEWMLVTDDKAFLQANPSTPADTAEETIKAPLWTDQYSNLFQILQTGRKSP
ncbi:MAG: fused MFS/spermidine synthase [Planctomycetaceae bacterium]|nr:fused MFS/spermidine synthase [Planctomycetaceae bacterium]